MIQRREHFVEVEDIRLLSLECMHDRVMAVAVQRRVDHELAERSRVPVFFAFSVSV